MPLKNSRIAQKIVQEILDKGLGTSTFREQYPDAYYDLTLLRPDMETSVDAILQEHKGNSIFEAHMKERLAQWLEGTISDGEFLFILAAKIMEDEARRFEQEQGG